MAKKKTEPKAKKHHRVQRNKKKLAKQIAKLFAKHRNTKPIANKETPAENTKILQKQTNSKHLATKKHKNHYKKKNLAKKHKHPVNKPTTLYPL